MIMDATPEDRLKLVSTALSFIEWRPKLTYLGDPKAQTLLKAHQPQVYTAHTLQDREDALSD